jgi:hypothetical protein
MTPTPNPSSNRPIYKNEESFKTDINNHESYVVMFLEAVMGKNKLKKDVVSYFCKGNCKPTNDVWYRSNHQRLQIFSTPLEWNSTVLGQLITEVMSYISYI